MTLKIGMIGCGHIAKFHARNIRDAISRHGIDADYHAVCDLDVGRAERFAQIGGCALVTTDAREVVDACEVIYVCTETSEHPPLIELAVAAGRQIFCEKPLARNLSDATVMADRVAGGGITHQVGLVLNFSPVYIVNKTEKKNRDDS